MPRISSREAPGGSTVPLGRERMPESPVSLFWDGAVRADEDRAGDPRTVRTEVCALWAVVLGLAGLAAVVLGESRHFGGVADAAVAAVALGGTVSAVVVANVALSRIRSSAGHLRGRLLAHLALVVAWSAVLVVFTAGALALLRSHS